MKVRLRDVASIAGVSEATVSRVVNGKAGVSNETRHAVLRALGDLGYEQRGIPGTRTGLIGLMVPELDNPIFPAFAQAIENGLAAEGYTAVLCTATSGGVHEDEYVEMLLERNVAGIVVVSGMNADTTADHGLYRTLLSRGMPMVFLNGYVEGLDAPFVSADDAHAAELAVRHLVGLGHERIGAVVGPRRYLPTQRRLTAFTAVLRQLGLPADLVGESVFSVVGGQVAAQTLLERGVTAVVAASDLMALGAIRVARQSGRRVPEDLSVTGYDDTALMAHTDPPLTTARQPVAAMSDTAVHALLDQIAGRAVHRHEYVFRPELVVRASTGPVPKTR